MHDMIYDIITFRKIKNGKLHIKNEQDFDQELLHVVAINILSWLLLEYKRSGWIRQGRRASHKPLMLDYSYPWCQELKKIMEVDDRFNCYFSLNERAFDFHPKLSDSERESIRNYVHENYKPGVLFN